jgi:uncharacterized protein (TIGR00725 family)
METAPRRVPIIAVFGSTVEETLALATLIGSAIVKRRGILLTGGVSSNGNAVKERAIAGAKAARSETCLGSWIGVARDATKPSFAPSESSCVIHTDLGHKRNFLEACLCDAAIALEGGKGTRSEVTFCLSLQKPVVLIGKWKAEYPLNKPETLEKLVDKAFNLVGRGPSGNSTLDELLNEKRILTNLQVAPLVCNDYPMPKKPDQPKVAEDAVGDAFSFLEQFRETGFKGIFPGIKGYENVKADYDSWLRRIEERLTAM